MPCSALDAQIFDEMYEMLGYRRRGHRITAALYKAIKEAKQTNSGSDCRR